MLRLISLLLLTFCVPCFSDPDCIAKMLLPKSLARQRGFCPEVSLGAAVAKDDPTLVNRHPLVRECPDKWVPFFAEVLGEDPPAVDISDIASMVTKFPGDSGISEPKHSKKAEMLLVTTLQKVFQKYDPKPSELLKDITKAWDAFPPELKAGLTECLGFGVINMYTFKGDALMQATLGDRAEFNKVIDPWAESEGDVGTPEEVRQLKDQWFAEMETYITIIDAALKTLNKPLPNPTAATEATATTEATASYRPLYRGVAYNEKLTTSLLETEKTHVVPKLFGTSMSIYMPVVEFMASNFNDWKDEWGAPKAVLFEIRADKGPVITAHSEKPGELEVLFPANTKVKTLGSCNFIVATAKLVDAEAGQSFVCATVGTEKGYNFGNAVPPYYDELSFLETFKDIIRRAQNKQGITKSKFPPAQITVIVQCIIGSAGCEEPVSDVPGVPEVQAPEVQETTRKGLEEAFAKWKEFEKKEISQDHRLKSTNTNTEKGGTFEMLDKVNTILDKEVSMLLRGQK